jgi:hypothetical protein
MVFLTGELGLAVMDARVIWKGIAQLWKKRAERFSNKDPNRSIAADSAEKPSFSTASVKSLSLEKGK